MSREKSIHGSQIAGRRPWDEDGVGTVQTPEEGQGGWSMWMEKRMVQDRVREGNRARSSKFCISQDKDFKSYS